MKKILPILILISILTLPFTVLAGAPAGGLTLAKIIAGIKTSIWTIFAGMIVIMLVWAGIMFLTAAGDPEKLGRAKKAFMWGIVGVIVGIIAFSVEAIVIAIF